MMHSCLIQNVIYFNLILNIFIYKWYKFVTLGVLIFAGTNFHKLLFLKMFEVQLFVFGLLSFAKIAKISTPKRYIYH